jgi:hypothetical protein
MNRMKVPCTLRFWAMITFNSFVLRLLKRDVEVWCYERRVLIPGKKKGITAKVTRGAGFRACQQPRRLLHVRLLPQCPFLIQTLDRCYRMAASHIRAHMVKPMKVARGSAQVAKACLAS